MGKIQLAHELALYSPHLKNSRHWLEFYYKVFFLIFVQILVRHLFSYVYSYCSNPPTNTLDCIDGCTGSVILNANCTESNSAENWADIEGETIFDIRNSTSSPLGLRLVNYNHVWMKPLFCFIKKKFHVSLFQQRTRHFFIF